MSNKIVFFCILTTFAALSCYSPTEHDTVSQCGVVKLRVSDNTIMGSVDGIPDGRALCSIGNTQFLVASGTGEIFSISSQNMTIDTSFAVGYAGGAGYRSMINPKPGSIYVTGSSGKVLEISLANFSVLDEFEAGSMPNVLSPSTSSTETFYVADGSDGRIRELNMTSNSVVRQTEALNFNPVALAPESCLNDYLLAACADGEGSVFRVSLATFHPDAVQLGFPCSDITAFPAESIWAVTHPQWQSETGYLSICSSYSPPDVQLVSLAGNPMRVCSVPGTTLFYVLSYLGDGQSRVFAVNFLTGEVEAEIDVAGFPWDITSHGNGEFVLVLTSEL
jgi:hypothetical protein